MPKYFPSHLRALPSVGIDLNRLFLHAARIAFWVTASLVIIAHRLTYLNSQRHRAHTGERYRLTVTAPLPPDFVQLCQALDMPLDPVWVDGKILSEEGTSQPETPGPPVVPADTIEVNA